MCVRLFAKSKKKLCIPNVELIMMNIFATFVICFIWVSCLPGTFSYLCPYEELVKVCWWAGELWRSALKTLSWMDVALWGYKWVEMLCLTRPILFFRSICCNWALSQTKLYQILKSSFKCLFIFWEPQSRVKGKVQAFWGVNVFTFEIVPQWTEEWM